jgi:hypothetical protein
VEEGARTGYHRRNATFLGRIRDMSASARPMLVCGPSGKTLLAWPSVHGHDENTLSQHLEAFSSIDEQAQVAFAFAFAGLRIRCFLHIDIPGGIYGTLARTTQTLKVAINSITHALCCPETIVDPRYARPSMADTNFQGYPASRDPKLRNQKCSRLLIPFSLPEGSPSQPGHLHL